MIQKLTKNLTLLATLILPLSVMAQTVVISEVGFRSSASVDDYVELYNTTGASIDLTGYTLVPSTGSTVTLAGTIPANGFYVIGKNTSEASFESSWGVTIGGTSAYENSGGDLSTSSGVTFTLRDASSTAIDNTTGYGISLGSRLYQCPVGSFAGNDQVETTVAFCSPGSVNSLSVDDLTHWTISRYNNSWDVGSVSSSTGSDNLIVKRLYYSPSSTDQINDVYLPHLSFLSVSTLSWTISGNLYLGSLGSVLVSSTGNISVTGTIYQRRQGAAYFGLYNIWSTPFSNSINIESSYTSVNPCDIYTFNASTQEWKYDYSTPYSTTCNGNSVTITSANTIVDGTSDGNFDVGRGYFVPGSSSEQTRTIEGQTFNNGSISVPIYGSSVAVTGGNDWNLIGNPYPSGVNVVNLLSNTNNAGFINAIYIYDGSTGSYSTYNSSTTYYISSCQGFFIHPATTTDGLLGNIEFENSMRHVGNWNWRNLTQTMFFSLYSSKNDTDLFQVIIDPESMDQLDNKHDAFKLHNQTNLNIASNVENELLVFNGIKPILNGKTKTVELFVQTPEAGNYLINLDSLNLIDEFLDIKLEDRSNNTFTDLRTGSYSFSTPSGDSLVDRFYLHLTNTVNSVNDLESALNASIYVANEQINVTVIGNDHLDVVEVYDVTGRIIAATPGNSNTMSLSTTSYGNGIYIVKVISESGNIATQRVFIK